MRVLWVDMVSELGGAQLSLFDACAALSAAGVEVFAAVPYGPLFDRLTAKGIQTFPVSPVRARKRGWGLFTTTAKLLRAPSSVAQIVHTVKPDIVHANNMTAFLATSRVHASLPVVWHVRDLQIPTLVARDAAKKAARLFAASEAIDEMLVDILSPRTLGRIRVIRNGIDIQPLEASAKIAARQRLGLPDTAPVVGMVAHLVPWKRHDAFIEAAAIIHAEQPAAHFVAIGRDLFHEHGRWISQLEKQVDCAGLSACFHWVRDCDDARTLMAAFDLMIHPALREPFGRVVCEAMAMAVPVIAVAAAGPAAIIQPNVSGILTHEGAPQELASEALSLLADSARAAAIGKAGRDRVLEQYDIHRVCDQLIKEYRSLLASLKSSASDDE